MVIALVALAGLVALLAIGIVATQVAWNVFVSPVFGLPQIDLGQTLAFVWLVLLVKQSTPSFPAKK